MRIKGFTLIEAIIAIFLVVVLVTSIAVLITRFSEYTRHNAIGTAVINAATSAIEMCRGGVTPPPIIEQGGISVSISFTCDSNPCCLPSSGSCSSITVTAQAMGKTTTLKDKVCNIM